MTQLLVILSMVISLSACDDKKRSINLDASMEVTVETAVAPKKEAASDLPSVMDQEPPKTIEQKSEVVEDNKASIQTQVSDHAEERQDQNEAQSNRNKSNELKTTDSQQTARPIKKEEGLDSQVSIDNVDKTSTKAEDKTETGKEVEQKKEVNVDSSGEKPITEAPLIEAAHKDRSAEPKVNDIVVDIHDQWQTLLQKHVSPLGVVDYVGLKSTEATLDKYLSDLSDHVPGGSDLSKEAKAFWINAYNAFTVKLILDHYPVQSIRDIAGGEPWDKKWIQLGSKMYSLNNIEHDILRPMWKDARIHFAVNCAAKSCPPLGNTAFTASNTDRLLEKLTKAFVNNSASNTISSSSLVLSKIFDWYRTDFGDLAGFIDKYTTVGISSDVKITYQDYDWSLNGK